MSWLRHDRRIYDWNVQPTYVPSIYQLETTSLYGHLKGIDLYLDYLANNIPDGMVNTTDDQDIGGVKTFTADKMFLARDILSRAAISAGHHAVAFGSLTQAGIYGAAFGRDSAAGDYALVAGQQNNAANFAIAAGYDCSAAIQSAAFGHLANALEGCSFAAGSQTEAKSFAASFGEGTKSEHHGLAAGVGSHAGARGVALGQLARGLEGTFVFADSSSQVQVESPLPNQFIVRSRGGAHFDTPFLAVTEHVKAEQFHFPSGAYLHSDGANLFFTNQYNATNQITSN